jgi:hypothetical protein
MKLIDILQHVEHFCSRLNSFATNDTFLLDSHNVIDTIVVNKFVDKELCCNAHQYLQALSLKEPWDILIRQFTEEQHSYTGTGVNDLVMMIGMQCLCAKNLIVNTELPIHDILSMMRLCTDVCAQCCLESAQPLNTFKVFDYMLGETKFDSISNQEMKWALSILHYIPNYKDINRDNIHIKKLIGTKNSECICGGLVLSVSMSNYQSIVGSTLWTTKIMNVLLVKGDINYYESMLVSQSDSYLEYYTNKQNAEESSIQSFGNELHSKSINFVFVTGAIKPRIQQVLSESNVGFMEHISDLELYHLSSVCQALPIAVILSDSTQFQIDQKFIGMAKLRLIEGRDRDVTFSIRKASQKFSSDRFLIVQTVNPSDVFKVVTLYIGGSNRSQIDRSEYIFWTCLHSMNNMRKMNKAVPDGGYLELMCLRELQNLQQQYNSQVDPTGTKSQIINEFYCSLKSLLHLKLSNYTATADECTTIIQELLLENSEFASPLISYLDSRQESDLDPEEIIPMDVVAIQSALMRSFEFVRIVLTTDSLVSS